MGLGLASFSPSKLSVKSIESGQAQLGGAKVPPSRGPASSLFAEACPQVGCMGVAGSAGLQH